MATRSRIALQLNETSFLSVYHHYDGYPQWLGVTLNKKFNTREKVAELIDGGDISCIESETDWNNKECEHHVQYYNDRGENTAPKLHENIDDYFSIGEEYAYVFTLDHEWECYAINHSYDKNYNVTDTNIVPKEIPTKYPVK